MTAPGVVNSVVGSLYVVATPIGNLDDISARALKVLRDVSLIAAEDTRHSLRLMQHFGISTPLGACHEHNERDEGSRFIQRLLAGEDVALISDAGTPLISDPGYHLVRQARAAGIPVVPVPGACALIAALSAAGLPSDRFIFEGFLPAKAVGRRTRLERLKEEPRTLIFYEAPHRILECLQDMELVFGPDRPALLARELTRPSRRSRVCHWLSCVSSSKVTAINSAESVSCWWLVGPPLKAKRQSAAKPCVFLISCSRKCPSNVRQRWPLKLPVSARTCSIKWHLRSKK